MLIVDEVEFGYIFNGSWRAPSVSEIPNSSRLKEFKSIFPNKLPTQI
jgi:hypothetical protein